MKPGFAAWIGSLGFRKPTPVWRAVMGAVLGQACDEEASALYTARTGGLTPSTDPEGLTRVLVVAGRRAGKSEEAARVAMYELLFGGHEAFLAPGQLGVFVIVCPKLETAEEVFNFASGIAAHKSVKSKIAKVREGEIELDTGLVLQIVTSDAFSVRGKTLVGAIVDEAAFLDSTSKGVSSQEIFDALLPGLQRIKGSPPRRCLVISSAYIKKGAAFEIYRDCYGVPDAGWTVFHGSSMDFNPDLDMRDVEKARKRSEKAYRREYLSEWQDAVDGVSWFGEATIANSVDKGRTVTPYEVGLTYVAGVDFAFRHDSTAVVIATHRKTATGSRVEVVYAEELKSPKGGASLREVAFKVKLALAKYRLKRCFIDQHEASSLKELLRDEGITALERAWKGTGADSKALKYNAVLDAFRDGRVRLPEHEALLDQLRAVTGELLPSGVERIEARRGHDDLVSALVLASDEAFKTRPRKADRDLSEVERDQQAWNQRNMALAFGSAGRFGW